MEAKDVILLFSIMLAVLVGTVCLVLAVNGDRRTRRAVIVSSMKKERMDELIAVYSKIISVCNPLVLVSAGEAFYKDVLEQYYKFSMLLNRTFEKDVRLTRHLKTVIDNAFTFYKLMQNAEQVGEELMQKYEAVFSQNLKNLDCDFTVYLSTEWQQSGDGNHADRGKWEAVYKENTRFYRKWNAD